MSETLALALAGIVAVPIIQVFKRYLHISGTPMAWITILLSIVIASITSLLAGEVTLSGLLADPLLFFGGGGVVMGVATVVYQSIKDKMGLAG